MFVVKECTKCKEYKLLEEFPKDKKDTFGFRSCCKLCIKEYYQDNKERIKEYRKVNQERRNEYQKEYYRANKEHIKNVQKEYYHANKERKKNVQKEYYQANKERIKEYYQDNKERIKEYINNRMSTDRMFKLRRAISRCIRTSIRGNGYTKKSRTHQILGCDYKTFKLHIERQFKKGMTWDNHGEWHLDHIYPVSLAKDEQHLIELNHYTNFQPLWASENIRKGNKIIEPIQMKLKI